MAEIEALADDLATALPTTTSSARLARRRSADGTSLVRRAWNSCTAVIAALSESPRSLACLIRSTVSTERMSYVRCLRPCVGISAFCVQ